MTNLSPLTPSNPTEEEVVILDYRMGTIEKRGDIWFAIDQDGEFLYPTRDEAIDYFWQRAAEEGIL